jgi:predicted DNA-binding transcriptional regulator YafY
MQRDDAAAARGLADRIHLVDEDDGAAPPPVPRPIADALSSRRVLRLRYLDRDGAPSTRDVEPLGYVGKGPDWYLVGWCRLRGEGRSFRLDRVRRASVTGETVPTHRVGGLEADVPAGWAGLPAGS